jgi:predicted metal-dependent phosphoesterase TrpH
MLRGDFHTHSVASYDGGIRLDDYRRMIEEGPLDIVAITDHDVIAPATIDLAEEYPGRVVVGEEITTLYESEDGKKKEIEIIGLWLREQIPKHLPTLEAAEHIIGQGGALYIPHPLDETRKGANWEAIAELYRSIGIAAMERYNGRKCWRPWLHNDYGMLADEWAKRQERPIARMAGSDAHGSPGWGRTSTALTELPSPENLIDVVDSDDQFGHCSVGFIGLLQPKYNKWWLHQRQTRQTEQEIAGAVFFDHE